MLSPCSIRVIHVIHFIINTDKSISNKHAQILFSNGSFFLEDFSMNGTKINGTRIEKGKQIKLNDGDVITLADAASFKIIIEDDSSTNDDTQALTDEEEKDNNNTTKEIRTESINKIEQNQIQLTDKAKEADQKSGDQSFQTTNSTLSSETNTVSTSNQQGLSEKSEEKMNENDQTTSDNVNVSDVEQKNNLKRTQNPESNETDGKESKKQKIDEAQMIEPHLLVFFILFNNNII